MCIIDATSAGGQNVCSFLDMLAVSEGTSTDSKTLDNGYDVLVGGNIFTGYVDHPRIYVPLPNLGITSSAAGRYQILSHNFDVYKAQLNLPDFSPLSQDLIAIQLMKECHAIQLLQNGDITDAIIACASRWASLPNSHYGQHTNGMPMLVAAYEAAGGSAA